MMLNAAVAQIRNSMSEGDDSVNALGHSFTFMMEQMARMAEIAGSMPESPARSEIIAADREVAARIQHVVTSFQFYDKLVQRLAHVSHSLGQLAELVGDEGRIYNPHAWSSLQDAIKAKYTVDADKQMFEAIISGATVEDALALAQSLRQSSTQEANADIDLF
jgi:hypothetical protein